MKLTISFDTDTKGFDEYPEQLQGILHGIGQDVYHGKIRGDIHDNNGEHIGKWGFNDKATCNNGIGILQWSADMSLTVMGFVNHWAEKRQAEPENYPATFPTMGEWDEQFWAYLSLYTDKDFPDIF